MSFLSFVLWPLLYYWARKAKPRTQGALCIPGLGEKVRVLWAPYAIPHVFASNELDLFLAQGYLHAQERLWQMDFNRRLVSGRLAEILGERPLPWKELSVRLRDKGTVELDYFVRLMGIRRAARASLRLLPQELVDRLQAYSEGVNRYIETHLSSLPLEFRLLRYRPEPWAPEDSLTIAKGFALFLSTSLFTRLTLLAITDQLRDAEAKLKSLYPAYPQGGPCVTRSTAAPARQLLSFLNGTFAESGWGAPGPGSNNWVISARRSATGQPLLCNDPHLRMGLPSVWYLMHLATPAGAGREGFEVWGASIPGSPCIHLGHNRRIAWGVTAALCDDGDLYREKVDAREPDRYLAGGEWQKMTLEEERIRVRGGGEVKKTIRFTRHGPVISDFTQGCAAGEVLAFRWTAHDPSAEFRALYGVNRARDWDEFLESLSHQVAPTLNYVYADSSGNIGYSLAGKIPLRAQPHSLLPLPGWSGAYDWKGYVPFSELPRLYNPPEGLIATANNAVVDRSYPYYLSDLFEPPYRIQRIKELLTAKDKFSLDDMAEIQKDVVSVQAREMTAALRADLEEIGRRDASLRETAERLGRWKGDCSEKSPEAALFHLLHQRLMRNLLLPDLGEELFLAYAELFNQALAPVDRILRDPQSPWFGSRPRLALVEKSLREAQQEIGARLGTDRQQWSWGRLHTLTLQHPLGVSRILKPFFSLGPFPAAGNSTTINLGFYRHSNPYAHIVGPSLRMVIDVGDWARSRFILPSGQSGHPFSPHYRDQLESWRRGDFLRLKYDEEESNQWPALILTPAK